MDQNELARAIREQVVWCERLGSPLYYSLLLQIADDVEAGGFCWKVMEPSAADAARSLLPLRFLAGVHRLALDGSLPEIARCYPSCGGTADPDRAFRAMIAQDAERLRSSMPAAVQTNEVSRCAALLPGFLEIARAAKLPLRLLEIGCSAGLNLRWDQYRYDTVNGPLGDPASPVAFDNPYTGEPPRGAGRIDIVERRGCDLNPIDPTTNDGRLMLLSFIWPDQVARFGQLSQAIEIARHVPAHVDRADALEWLEQELANTPAGSATVVFHPIVLLYFSRENRERTAQLLARAGERATEAAPLAWLSMEPGENQTDVHLTIWPGGERKRIATAGFHGRPVLLD